jgi:hypothetical protein
VAIEALQEVLAGERGIAVEPESTLRERPAT